MQNSRIGCRQLPPEKENLEEIKIDVGNLSVASSFSLHCDRTPGK